MAVDRQGRVSLIYHVVVVYEIAPLHYTGSTYK